MLRSTRRRNREAPGQIIVLFVLSLTAIFAMAALLFDGAHALVLRREFQNASDSAALAAANLIQTGSPKGCSATAGPPPGTPRSAITAAAVAAVQAALPGTPASAIQVTCPDGWSNYAVQVDINGQSPSFFGGAVGVRGFDVRTTSQAVNGQVTGLKYSIVELDPGNPTWSDHTHQGCPSVGMGGGPTVVLEGSMQINSSCSAVAGGALYVNGNGGSLTLNNSSVIRITGGYVSNMPISPMPTTGSARVRDPLAGLPAMPTTLPIRATSRRVFGGSDQILEPGIYQGGIQLKNSVKAFLHPGIYVMQGGGFDIGAQNAVYSVAAGVSSTTDAAWATNCPVATCGVLLYNTGTSTTFGQITVGAGATLKLRPYVPTADGSGANVVDYQHLLIWQDASPVPSNTYWQPVLALNGGGTVDISGTVYAPSAAVTMGGGSGGSGGGTDVTLQFISWDLQFQGNSSFHFYYQSDAFAKPTDYGLIK